MIFWHLHKYQNTLTIDECGKELMISNFDVAPLRWQEAGYPAIVRFSQLLAFVSLSIQGVASFLQCEHTLEGITHTLSDDILTLDFPDSDPSLFDGTIEDDVFRVPIIDNSFSFNGTYWPPKSPGFVESYDFFGLHFIEDKRCVRYFFPKRGLLTKKTPRPVWAGNFAFL